MHVKQPAIQIDTNTCDYCGLCVRVCDSHVLSIHQDQVVVEHLERCGGCGVCEELCPRNAISLRFDIVWDTTSPGDSTHDG